MAIRVCAVGALGTLAIGLSGCGSSSPDPTPAPAPLADPCDAEWQANLLSGTPPADFVRAPTRAVHAEALASLNITAVLDDLDVLLTQSHPCWPADWGNYGPFFIRNAWHCSGSFRKSDLKGGCGGGRHRFEPQRSWDDNTNLDKARALLNPIKEKYGEGLSWGDLIVAAGTQALRSMGAPATQMCFGRVDAADGTDTLDLGPSEQQNRSAPCVVNGDCHSPLGSTTVGLIYVNPEGPVTEEGGDPDPTPALLVAGVRDSFDRMNHNDRATVALIGGGHAFGKVHGACPSGPGLSPKDTFESNSEGSPWISECAGNGEGNTGKGLNTFTSGFEGQWTSTPLQWSNQFFIDLKNKEWELFIGPGGHNQWRVKDASESDAKLMRLTSDMALLEDHTYRHIVDEFAEDIEEFGRAFDTAWFELTTTHGSGRWSNEAKCDHGHVPVPDMLDTDISV